MAGCCGMRRRDYDRSEASTSFALSGFCNSRLAPPTYWPASIPLPTSASSSSARLICCLPIPVARLLRTALLREGYLTGQGSASRRARRFRRNHRQDISARYSSVLRLRVMSKTLKGKKTSRQPYNIIPFSDHARGSSTPTLPSPSSITIPLTSLSIPSIFTCSPLDAGVCL